MWELMASSYGALYMLVILETCVLYELVHRTAQLKRPYKWDHKAGQGAMLPPGTRAPAFSASLITSDQVLTSRDLVGRSTILLFISPDEKILPDSDVAFFAHVVWHKSNGNAYLVCCGEADVCQKFSAQAMDVMEHRIPVLWDHNGQIARQFQITVSPQAVELDREARVVRYGGIESEDKALETGKLMRTTEDVHVS
jgi:hypothetical protein